MLKIIDLFNRYVSNAIDKLDSFYKTLIGDPDFVSEAVIQDSADIKCGAIINEMEWAKLECWKMVDAMNIDLAAGTELDTTINAVVNLPRRGTTEKDSTYRNRFHFLVTDKTNYRRLTKWAILDAISYFVTDMSRVQLIEPFDSYSNYFQVRIEGIVSYSDIIFLDNLEQGFIGHNFIGGAGVGEVITYLGDLIKRVRVAGVDFDILFINQARCTKNAGGVIGAVQQYKTANARVLRYVSVTKTSNATVV